MQGDGIGPEITAATLQVLREVDRLLSLNLSFEDVTIGLAALKAHGTTLPDVSFEAAKRADGVILGPVSHNVYPPADQGGINRRARCASGSISMRMSAPPRHHPACSRASPASRSISS